jgi:hypothetical protein
MDSPASPRRASDELNPSHNKEIDRDDDLEEADLQPKQKPRVLPDDLPTSLDDRRSVPMLQETEMYDAWQGGWYTLIFCAVVVAGSTRT